VGETAAMSTGTAGEKGLSKEPGSLGNNCKLLEDKEDAKPTPDHESNCPQYAKHEKSWGDGRTGKTEEAGREETKEVGADKS